MPQARGVDSTVWFELYHASRESFTYIKEFYIGEIALEDRGLVPHPAEASGLGNTRGQASEEFMEQLREYCDSFRIDPSLSHQREAEAMVMHKSF